VPIEAFQVGLVRNISCLPRATCQRAISLQPRDPRRGDRSSIEESTTEADTEE
jgi:hypothetical protein